MAKAKLNSTMNDLRGAIGGLVFKRYGDQIVVSKYPDMSRVKRSRAQKDQIERMKWAAHYYRHVLGSPALKARYAKQAKDRKTTIHRLATKEYMRVARKFDRVNVLPELGA